MRLELASPRVPLALGAPVSVCYDCVGCEVY